MAATSFKIRNPQKGIFAPQMLQVNHGKYVSTEILKNSNTIPLKEESIEVEDTMYANGFRTNEHGQLIKVRVQQQKAFYNNSVDKWPDSKSNSMDSRKRLALTASGVESKTRLTSEVANKRLPVLVHDGGHTYMSQRRERNSLEFSQERKMNCSEGSTNSTKPKIIKKEALFQDVEDFHAQDIVLQRGVPFHDSDTRRISKNNIPRRIDTTDQCKRIKMSDGVMTVRSVGRVCQKPFDQRQLPHKNMPTVSGAVTYSNKASSATFKTEPHGIPKDKYRSPPPNDVKRGVANGKEKDKTEGSTTRRRFLLIDSQGLPYTVVIEEPRSIGLSNSSSTSWSDSTPSGVSKSLAPRKVYKCPVCFRIFEYLSYLQRHSIAHSQQKPHVCKVCGKAFKRTSHLTRHKYTHFGGKPCHCQVCHRRFRDVGELARHQQSHIGEKKSLI
ncbi:hypothetical protein GDO81_014500 [Engystomops pustulosus]|uniref:C2H2-type domain-containing protein n=1 Tax=Engystomops pustulosus TaxID=76066 RepID=A0AAV7BB48_ENGPU|nr:hypothetical protein GDO81_014500 [Engystomops pustulosus]